MKTAPECFPIMGIQCTYDCIWNVNIHTSLTPRYKFYAFKISGKVHAEQAINCKTFKRGCNKLQNWAKHIFLLNWVDYRKVCFPRSTLNEVEKKEMFNGDKFPCVGPK